VTDISSDENDGAAVPTPLPAPGVHRPPPRVTDRSGDPERHYYIPRPSPNLIGPRWVVWCGLEPGIYDSW
jgi:hypothetical protein